MIDLHSHLLPNIDDGSQSVERSREVLERFAADGVAGVVLTPHVKSSAIVSDADGVVKRRLLAYETLAPSAPTVPALYLGFEIRLDEPLPEAFLGDRRFSLAESRYYLVEFPLDVVPQYAKKVLRLMVKGGVTPIVAHPERYRACDAVAAQSWRDSGAKMQVDATTITRPTSRGRRARELIELGLADVLAADNHGDGRTLATAAAYLRERDGDLPGRKLLAENPRAVIEDREMTDVPLLPLRERPIDRLRRFMGI